jgi:hypothetical protein
VFFVAEFEQADERMDRRFELFEQRFATIDQRFVASDLRSDQRLPGRGQMVAGSRPDGGRVEARWRPGL